MASQRRRIITVISAITLLLLGMGFVFAYSTWGEVNRVTIDREEDPVPEPAPVEEGQPTEEEPEAELLTNEVYLLVGSDSRDTLEHVAGFGVFEGMRADVVMVLITTPSGTALLSLPRDLWVPEACGGAENRLNALLEGCSERMNGPTLLLRSVEDLIGETVDHYAMVDLAGFQEVVDRIGGYEICIERPVRDTLAALDLPAGCTLASGAETLSWLRSRHTQELTENGWRTLPGVNDLMRNDRQRQFLIDMMARLSDFSSPGAMTSAAGALAPFITVDDQLTIGDAVSLAWIMRGLNAGQITEIEVPVVDHVTDDGAAVLVPVTPVEDLVAGFLDGLPMAEAPGLHLLSVRT
jgi:LCP family protein required for cell wall assembly